MQLLPTGHNPRPDAAMICRHTAWGPALFHFGALAFLLALAVKLALELTLGIEPELKKTIVPLAVFGLIAWLTYGHSGFMLRPDNWTLALHPGGLWINLRQPYPQVPRLTESVLHLSHDEIHAAREHDQTYYRHGSKGKRSSKARYFDLLVPEETSDTVWLILEEIGNPSSWVTVPDPGVIRIETDKESFHLRPGRKRVLAELSKYISIADATQTGAT